MANEAAMVKPSNAIVYDRKGIHVQTKKVETATNVYPGRHVKKGTNDDDVVVGTAYSSNVGPIGWAGYLDTTKKYRPATVDTIYSASDQIAVINGPGIILVGSLALGANITKGQLLKAVAAGQLSGAAMGTDHVVAIAEESIDASAAAADCLVRSLI